MEILTNSHEFITIRDLIKFTDGMNSDTKVLMTTHGLGHLMFNLKDMNIKTFDVINLCEHYLQNMMTYDFESTARLEDFIQAIDYYDDILQVGDPEDHQEYGFKSIVKTDDLIILVIN